MEYETILRIEGITSQTVKRPPLLNSLCFDLYKGEIFGILGRSEAGKSTLSNILTGNYFDYSGQIYYAEELISIRDLDESKALGIYCIREKSGLLQNLDIAQNLLAVRESERKMIKIRERFSSKYPAAGRVLNRSENYIAPAKNIWDGRNYRKLRKLLDEWGLHFAASKTVSELTRIEQCLVEMLKAVISDAKIVIIDEITYRYGKDECEILEKYIERLADTGISVIFMDSKLRPMTDICDRIMVLKDGKNVGVYFKSEFSERIFEGLLTDQEFRTAYKSAPIHGKPVAKVTINRGTTGELSFEVYPGETIGFVEDNMSGSVDITGFIPGRTGKKCINIWTDGMPACDSSIRELYRSGMGYIISCSDRDNLFPDMTAEQNLNILILDKLSDRWGIVKNRVLAYCYRECAKRFGFEKIIEKGSSVARFSVEDKIWLYIARQALIKPKVLVMYRSIERLDFISRKYLLSLLDKLKNGGTAILMFSVQLSNVEPICDKIIHIGGKN